MNVSYRYYWLQSQLISFKVTITYYHFKPLCLILNFSPHRTRFPLILEQIRDEPSLSQVSYCHTWEPDKDTRYQILHGPIPPEVHTFLSQQLHVASRLSLSSAVALALGPILHNAKQRFFYSKFPLASLAQSCQPLHSNTLCLPKNILT